MTADTGILSSVSPFPPAVINTPATSTTAPAAGRIRRRVEAADGASSTSNVSLFLRSPNSSSIVRDLQAICGGGAFVDCRAGEVNGDPSRTPCSTACGGQCCIGFFACHAFTGTLCKSAVKPSCDGNFACFGGDIDVVQESCIGADSCRMAGLGGKDPPSMTSSCVGSRSCYKLGYLGGSGISDVKSSCVGVSACEDAGSSEGGIGGMINSCNADRACWNAGENATNAISQIVLNCCNAVDACKNTNQATIPATCQVRFLCCVAAFLRGERSCIISTTANNNNIML